MALPKLTGTRLLLGVLLFGGGLSTALGVAQLRGAASGPDGLTPTPSPTPTSQRPLRDDPVQVSLTGPTTVQLGVPTTYTATITWQYERPKDIRIDFGTALPVGPPCTPEAGPPRPVEPGSVEVHTNLTFTRTGITTVRAIGRLGVCQYFRGSATDTLSVLVTGTAATPP